MSTVVWRAIPSQVRWRYFVALEALLRLAPRPMWRIAAVFAAVKFLVDRASDRSMKSLQKALGLPPTRRMAWRLNWSRCFESQAALLLLFQWSRWTGLWAITHARLEGHLPSGGAILVAHHHANARIGLFVLASMGYVLGAFVTDSDEYIAQRENDPAITLLVQRGLRAQQGTFHDRRFLVRQNVVRRAMEVRRAVHHLQQGGYISLLVDNFWLGGPRQPLLGRMVQLPMGAAVLAQRSGKPIIPFVVVTGWREWTIRFGEQVSPTAEGIAQALTWCIAQAPGSWEPEIATAWSNSPACEPCEQSQVSV